MKLNVSIPGLDSYRGRYLYLSAIALMLITLFAYTSWQKITEASLLSRKHIDIRKQHTNLLNTIINQHQLIRSKVYKYSLTPETFNGVEISHSVVQLLQLLEQIDTQYFDNIDSEKLNDFIFQIPVQLHYKTINLVEIRSDTELWIPATRIMSEELFPANEQVLTSLNNILHDDALLGAESLDITTQLLDIKSKWLFIISEFRLMTANRMGIFDLTRKGITSRQHNLELHLQLLSTLLRKLKASVASDQYGYVRDFLVPEMDSSIQRWSEQYKLATEQLMQPFWRRDILELQQIESLLNQFNQIFLLLQNELAIQSNMDTQSLDQINRSLSFYFILVSLLVLLISTLGYLLFDRNILRPISHTTRALLLQSQGMSQELDVTLKASETRDLIVAFNHMSEKIKQREKRLDYIAHHDTLTNLPNRLMFNERLKHAIQLTDRNDNQLALMMLDLDRFKLINDSLGHIFGDKLLQQTAGRLTSCMRNEDTIARLGGDEFAIIIENIKENSEVETLAHKIIGIFEDPFIIEDQQIYASTSIGIAMAPLQSRDPTTLVRYADIAMYQSKNMGRNQFTWFNNDLEHAEESMINFENQLREAITGHQFELHFQPLIDIDNSNSISSEALLRWCHPQKGMLFPDNFISILDNSDLLFDLTCWVIRESQKFQLQVEERYRLIPHISINLHSSIFQQKHFRNRIEAILIDEISHPEFYVLEVTEDTLITDMASTSETLERLHKKGFKIALDDFGTGQSSLSHLRVFPIDIIKIDREFIRDVYSDANDANLVSAIISLGHDLGMQVIAEGVEFQKQLDFLSAKGCHLIQGHLFSEPMPAEDYLEYVQQQVKSRKTVIA